MALERERGVVAVSGPREVLEPGDLELLESGVRQVGDLVVVAGEDDRVTGEPSRAAVVVEVVEVGEQDRRAAESTAARAASHEASGLIERLEPDRGPGQLDELLLEAPHPPVREPRRRLARRSARSRSSRRRPRPSAISSEISTP